MTKMPSPTHHPRRAAPLTQQALLLLGRAVKGVAVLFGLLLLAVVVFILLWLQGSTLAGRSFKTLKAAAERELVVGTDRATIEQFFVERGFDYRVREDYLFAPEGSALSAASRRRAYVGWRERHFGVLRIADNTRIVVVLDEQDRLAALEVKQQFFHLP